MTSPFIPLPEFVEPNKEDFINLHATSLRAYLDRLRQENKYLDNQGLAMDDQEYTGSSNKVSLDSLYVFPAASEKRIDPEDMVKLKKGEDKEELSELPKVISDNPRVTLLGDPGIGKSTFIQWLALSMSYPNTNAAKRWFDNLLPLVLTARKLSPIKEDTDDAISFLDTIIQSMGYTGEPLTESSTKKELEGVLTTGQIILLVDGVDEISTEKSHWLATNLKHFFKQYPSVRLILTARVVGFDSFDFWQLKQVSEWVNEFNKLNANMQNALTERELLLNAPSTVKIKQANNLEERTIQIDNFLFDAQDQYKEITDNLFDSSRPYPHFYLSPLTKIVVMCLLKIGPSSICPKRGTLKPLQIRFELHAMKHLT